MNLRNRILFLCLAVAVMLSGCVAAPETTTEAPVPTYTLGGDLICVEVSRFSGSFVEDGSDAKVTDVAAILVENRTGKFLELGTVTYKVGDRTATFKITGLPTGERAWVLEKNRMTIGEGDELVFDDCQTTYHPDPVRTTDDLAVRREGNSLTVENKSGRTLQNVCVYYKNRMEDGTFLGGITYLIKFGQMEPGAVLQRATSHFGDESEIVRFSYQTA
jgi:Fe-S cluster assembly iron-binding protein IscA